MDSGGAFSVFVRDFNSLEPRLIPGSEEAHAVFWSPDSRSLYLTARGKLWRNEGNTNILLADSPAFMLSGAWLNPKQILLGGFRGSYLVSPSGGPLEPVKSTYSWAQMLPGGENILYVRWDARAGRNRAHIARLSDLSDIKDLIDTDSRVLYTASTVLPGKGYLLNVRAGNLLATPFDPRSLKVTGEAMPVAHGVYSFAKTGAGDFSVSDRGVLAYHSYVNRSQLIFVDREGHQLSAIGPANVNVKSGRLSPDGNWLTTAIYDIERGQQDLWIFDVKTNTGRRLSAEPALRDAPVWSPDSKTIAFLFQDDGNAPKVHLRGLGEKDPEEAMPVGRFPISFRLVPRRPLSRLCEYRLPEVGERDTRRRMGVRPEPSRATVSASEYPIPRGEPGFLARWQVAGVHVE
jgi:dipeptidyl aminopeptidase/acylaminoacyl peptidase